MFVNGQFQNIDLRLLYQNQAAFLLLNGPSLTKLNLAPLREPGFLTVGLNNIARVFRPDIWIASDRPERFLPSVFADPKILKFVRKRHLKRAVTPVGTLEATPAHRFPAVVGFRASTRFDASSFLEAEVCSLGGRKARSTMLAALKIMYSLGIRKVFLLGCDFSMQAKEPYCFHEPVPTKHTTTNNRAYEGLQTYLTQLAPLFEAAGFAVFNCNTDSCLRAFPFVDYDLVVAQISDRMEQIQADENGKALYFQSLYSKENQMETCPPSGIQSDLAGNG